MTARRRWISLLTALALGPCLVAGSLEAGWPDGPGAPAWQAADKTPAEESAAAPRPPKERMEVSVLVAWTWLSILVLFWLVRLRAREADRVYRLGLRGPAAKPPKGAGH